MTSGYAVGERIRYFRKKAGMTQKELADKLGLGESTIRNYELGNREPDFDTLNNIADELQVCIYALEVPNINEINGMVHILFEMEEMYQLIPDIIDGEVVLRFDTRRLKELYGENPLSTHMPRLRKEEMQELEELLSKIPSPDAPLFLEHQMRSWCCARKDFTNGRINIEEYEDWKMKYPSFSGVNAEGDAVCYDADQTDADMHLIDKLLEEWDADEEY